MNDQTLIEDIIEPELPIVDSHHHLWFRPEAFLAGVEGQDNFTAQLLAPAFRRNARYLFDEYLADLNSGHNIRATVLLEASSMYRTTGPEELRSIGEVEFANGTAAIAASGVFTDVKICAAIVGSVDLRLGDAARDILLAHIDVAGGRYRGVRGHSVIHDDDPRMLGPFGGVPHLMLDSAFRAGFRHLAQLGLSYDAWQTEYQLPELLDLVQAFPDTQVIVNHTGGLFGVGRYEGRTEERFAAWRTNIQALARCPNVAIKLGGLGMPMNGLPTSRKPKPVASSLLAEDWRPYVETCIDAFGADRCMFESNFPVDSATTSYAVLWNAFKRIVSGASADDKAALFSGTAARLYRIEI